MMDLETALAYVRAREKIRRRSWQPRDKHVCLSVKRDGTSYYAIYQDQSLLGEYDASAEDFGAYDWECLAKKKPQPGIVPFASHARERSR